MIDFIRVSLGVGGNGCAACGDRVMVAFRPTPEVLAEVHGRVDENGVLPDLSFGGAEPLAHPELPAILMAAADAGCERMRLETDAAGLGIGDNASGSIAVGVRQLEVEVGGGAPAHDRFVGRDGALAASRTGIAAWRGAAGAAGARVTVWARVPLCAHTAPELADAVVTAASLGARWVTIDAEASSVDVARAADDLAAACDTATVNGVWASLVGVPYCLVPGRELHVAAAIRPAHELAKAPACAGCALDDVCAGVSLSAPVSALEQLDPPGEAARLAGRILEARGVGS